MCLVKVTVVGRCNLIIYNYIVNRPLYRVQVQEKMCFHNRTERKISYRIIQECYSNSIFLASNVTFIQVHVVVLFSQSFILFSY